MNRKKDLAPYGGELLQNSVDNNKSIVVLTGSEAWNIATTRSSVSILPKLLLPFGENPSCFIWPVSGHDVIIFSHGKPESYDTLLALSRCLLESGALYVVWCVGHIPITKVEPKQNSKVVMHG